MPTRVGWIGPNTYALNPAGQEMGRIPIATAASDGSYVATSYTNVSLATYQNYWTINRAQLQLAEYEYPVRVTFSDYSADGWQHSTPSQFGAKSIRLTLSSGDTWPTNEIDLVSSGIDGTLQLFGPYPSAAIPVDTAKKLCGQKLSIVFRNNGNASGTWFWGHAKVTIETAYTFTKCGAPSNVSVTNPSGGYSTLSWNAGSAGVNNAISSYEIQYRTSNDNSTWGNWTAEGSVVSTTLSKRVFSNPANSVYKQFRVRTVGAAGTSWASDWVTSNTIVVNTTPPTFTATITQVKLNSAVSNNIYIKGMTKYIATITNAAASGPKTVQSYSITDSVSGQSTTTSR